MLLSEMGAEIIKIDSPEILDVCRRLPPFADGKEGPNRCGKFALYNRGKKECQLDLKQPEALEIAKTLIKKSDIVISNFSPRAMIRLGLDYPTLKEINPTLIMVCASGYGATGPDRDALAYGTVLESYSGLSLLIGYKGGSPMGCDIPISDHLSACLSALAVIGALHHRDITGEGQYIDISEIETLIACIPEAIMEFTMNGKLYLPQGNRDDFKAPHGCYPCRGEDQWVAIAVNNDSEWKGLCLVMNKPELIENVRFRDGFLRLKNQDELDAIIASWTTGQSAMDVMIQLQKADIASGPVYNAENLYKDPQLRERGFFIAFDHPEVGKRELPGVVAKFSKTPGVIKGREPLVGEHTKLVLDELHH